MFVFDEISRKHQNSNASILFKPEKDLSALCQQYDSVLSSILDKHASVTVCKYKDSAQKTTNSMDDSGNNEG